MVGGIIFEVIRLVLWIKNTASAVRKAKWNIIDFLAVLVVDIKFYWTWFNMKELQYNKGEVDSLWETDTLAKKKCSRYVEWGLYHMSHLCTFIFCGWSHSVDLDTTQDSEWARLSFLIKKKVLLHMLYMHFELNRVQAFF